jgi:hypothetical protein
MIMRATQLEADLALKTEELGSRTEERDQAVAELVVHVDNLRILTQQRDAAIADSAHLSMSKANLNTDIGELRRLLSNAAEEAARELTIRKVEKRCRHPNWVNCRCAGAGGAHYGTNPGLLRSRCWRHRVQEGIWLSCSSRRSVPTVNG